MKLSTVFSGFLVRTLTLFRFVAAVLGGTSRRAAWLAEVGVAFSLGSGYRLWRRLKEAQSSLRARLCRLAPAPRCDAHEPLAELLAHLGAVAHSDGKAECDVFAAFQGQEQLGLFD